MSVFLNGQFVPEEQAHISVFDRGFLYGDGLFETMRVVRGQPFRWQQHWERLQRGADFIQLTLPFNSGAMRAFADELIVRNALPDALLRLTVTRGVGERGYSPKGAQAPSVVMSLHPAPKLDPRQPPRWRLMTSWVRLPAGDALAQLKTCNKLPQILARSEAEAAGVDEALLANTDGSIVEAASSNLFWVQADTVCTSPLVAGLLAGVTRAVVLELCASLSIPTRQSLVTSKALSHTDGVFLSMSSLGIVEACALDGQLLAQSPLTARLQAGYNDLLAQA